MKLKFLGNLLEYAIFSAAVLLVFLVSFEKYLEVPLLFRWIGHWHPLILHFPIVLIFVTIIQYWRKDNYVYWYLGVTALFALISSLSGFILSTENATKGNQLLAHQWAGIGASVLLVIWWHFYQQWQIRASLVKGVHILLAVLIIFTGHVGGTITHGNNFLSFSTGKVKEQVPTDNPNIYSSFVQPILNDKCTQCHNAEKSKGKLILTDYVSLASGGETGAGLDFSDIKNSLLLHRMILPLEDEDHMPPSDEKQLTAEQMMIIEEWLKAGASDTITMNGLAKESKLHALVSAKIVSDDHDRFSQLPEVSDAKLTKLSSDYIQISRIYHGSNAVQVTAFNHTDYNVSQLKGLNSISNNIIALDLQGLPVQAGEISLIKDCQNLEKLNLSNSDVDDNTIEKLGNLGNMRELILYNTAVTDKVAPFIRNFPALKKLYIYNTQMTPEGIVALNNSIPNLQVFSQSEQAIEFVSVLPPATVSPRVNFFNDQLRIKLTHPLRGINVYYTLDGSMPSESSLVQSDSLLVQNTTMIKFFAAKEGWDPSRVDSVFMMKCGKKPDLIELINASNEKYAGRGSSQLIDLVKGPDDYADSSWMAFREKDMVLQCEWNTEITLAEIILSTMVKTDSYLFPPESIIIKAGFDRKAMAVIYEKKLTGLRDRKNTGEEYLSCSFSPKQIKYVEIIVKPLPKIPLWHQGVGDKGWFFIDEVVFVEK